MPLVHAIDLAAVAWAQRLDGDGLTVETCALTASSEDEAVHAITQWWQKPRWSPVPDVMVIEDQPHGVRFDSIAKSVARFQGRIIERMDQMNYKDKILFVPPALWQRSFPGVWKAGPVGAAAAAKELGYEPPDLLTQYEDSYKELHGSARQKVRARLQKLMTDYVDAFLIARWAHNTYEAHGTFDVPSTQRYVR